MHSRRSFRWGSSGSRCLIGAVLGIRRGVELVDPADRGPPRLAALVLAFGVHALVDYDLGFLAVSAPTPTALGGLLALGRPRLPGPCAAAELVALAAATAAAGARGRVPRPRRRRGAGFLDVPDADRIADAVDAVDRARLLNPPPAPPRRGQGGGRGR